MPPGASTPSLTLRDAGVVNDEDGIGAAHQAVGGAGEFSLDRRLVPKAVGNEVVEAVVPRRIEAFGHGLHALALARTDQARHIERTHLPSLLCPSRATNGFRNSPSASSQLAMARAPIRAQTSTPQRYQSVNPPK